ncbi:TPA: hypothetical protein ACHVX6_000277 [Listeria monocytogenes]|nr:hypothetical protein [Listeria monocytogenes]EJE1830305.1 hypothetical protein [Listeria monocytogenes]EJE1920881.1 hypothetical protein [Listeria monocytogenes]EJE2819930.1 hypothetical protein [Listeria monocytogenes]EJE3236064.1 hypothetical protein [Listeria monocytogenes]
MNKRDTNNFMKQAVPLAREMEGDWNIRMSIALKSVILNHYFTKPLSEQVVQFSLAKGVSYRGICKHYGVYRHQLNELLK